ncbi:MAG: class I SAM-dependent DNA methyltransferase [Parabacteroides sp.]|nr:class I SAM-dependent DNA methyltransferase [Parabacteroides sp.]
MANKLNLSYKDIEGSLKTLKVKNVQPSDVGYIILQAFGKSDADIRRYREGKGVLASFCGLLIKGLFCFRAEETVRMTETLEALKHDPLVVKAAPKIIVVSDGNNVLAYDMREKETYENPLNRMYCDFAFFYPLIGIERFHHVEENPADVKAAEKLAKLHDELRTYNEFSTADDLHDLNIFIARLLFCFFAEDTNIFENNLFTGSIVRYTQEDGSDISNYLSSAFNIMDIRERNEDTLKIISQFPFVNGGLFSKQITIPHMGQKARKLLIECGELDWKNINPDILGSMIQAVVNPEERANQGMHYTSVPNIMKVINPLFLDELRDEYEKLKQQFEEKERMVRVGALRADKLPQEAMPIHRACSKLLQRMSAMKFFDPACGSGNFLIITYKMLRFLEMDILRLQHRIDPKLDFIDSSCIRLSQFYGIELLDFPHEIAMLSLWLAEHQMNRMLHDDFGVNTQALPLKNITQIVCGNACRLDWDVVCPHTKEEEVFVFGNPPYLGSKLQSSEQKQEIGLIFGKRKNCKILDYIACWFEKASLYIQNSLAKYAFVSTNSVCQGEQVSALWPEILGRKQEINFAHTSSKWSNNAKYNAGVTVVIIGVSSHSNKKKVLFNGETKTYCSSINPYLSIGAQTVVSKETKTSEGLPRICFGCMPYDSGHLLFDAIQYQDFIHNYPNDAKHLKKIYGSEEYIKGIDIAYGLMMKKPIRHLKMSK